MGSAYSTMAPSVSTSTPSGVMPCISPPHLNHTSRDELRALRKSQPPPSLKEIKEAIPKHCFERSLARSLALVIRDGVIIFALVWAGTHLSYENLCPHDYI